jgi:hypothetical protein
MRPAGSAAVVIMALSRIIIPPKRTIHQEKEVRLAKFCSQSLEIYQVRGMAMKSGRIEFESQPGRTPFRLVF